jgi:hypothetical protein
MTMLLTKDRAIIAAALLGVAFSLTSAQAQTAVNQNGGRVAAADLSRSHVASPIDRDGWRLRNGNWDNTCFNLPYLSSMSACSR